MWSRELNKRYQLTMFVAIIMVSVFSSIEELFPPMQVTMITTDFVASSHAQHTANTQHATTVITNRMPIIMWVFTSIMILQTQELLRWIQSCHFYLYKYVTIVTNVLKVKSLLIKSPDFASWKHLMTPLSETESKSIFQKSHTITFWNVYFPW